MGLDSDFILYSRKKQDASYDDYREGWRSAIKFMKKEKTFNIDDDCPYEDIINDMNEVLGKAYKPILTTVGFIKARWKEGYKREDFKKVCEIKHAEWDNDPKMRLYLRPETLFGTKFDSYLNQESKHKRTVDPEWL